MNALSSINYSPNLFSLAPGKDTGTLDETLYAGQNAEPFDSYESPSTEKYLVVGKDDSEDGPSHESGDFDLPDSALEPGAGSGQGNHSNESAEVEKLWTGDSGILVQGETWLLAGGFSSPGASLFSSGPSIASNVSDASLGDAGVFTD